MTGQAVAELLRRAAEDAPDTCAVTDPLTRASLTYADLFTASQRGTERIHASAMGAPLAIAVSNSVASVVELLSVAMAGLPVLVVGASLPEAERQRAESAFAECSWGDSVEDAGCFTLATSGTSGRSKLVVHRWVDFVANAATFATVAGYRPGGEVVVTTPLHHAYALGVGLLGAVAARGTVLLAPLPLDLSHLRRLIADRRPSVLQSVPFVYRALAERDLAPLASLSAAISAGDRLDADVVAAWRTVGVPLRNQYGTTETGVITYNTRDVEASVGTPIDGVTVRVDAGGGLAVRMEQCRSAYIEDGATVPVFGGGWFRPGDVGTVDGDGNVFLTGRVTDGINVGGNKVDAREVEDTILALPRMRACAVVGRPAGLLGEEVCAFVVSDGPLDPGELRGWLRRQLAAFKVPTKIRELAELPTTSSGKVDRAALRELATGALRR